MKSLHQSFSVPFQYQVHFTQDLFHPDNRTFIEALDVRIGPRKVLLILDQGVVDHHPSMVEKAHFYLSSQPDLVDVGEAILMPGGEQVKNDYQLIDRMVQAINDHGIDRHSYIAAIGGGSVLDAVGLAAAISHRGIRLIRVPTTVLSQNDSGVGVKNGVNAFGKKNFIGTFAPPFAVINDKNFLTTLDDRDWRSGIAEGIKVGLIKDADFFQFIEQEKESLNRRADQAMSHLIYRCAELHLNHIASGDPFEMGSSRPLDFGHWSAHKLEQLTGYEIRHGEAVAIGMALDATYSTLEGRLTQQDLDRVTGLMTSLGFDLYHPELENPALLDGLREFQEHLGGQLTVMLLEEIGKGVEVHTINTELVKKSINLLRHHQNDNMPEV